MPLALLLLAVLVGACSSPAPRPAAPDPAATVSTSARVDSTVLFDFADDGPRWRVVNDGVMGGRSQGYLSIEGGTMAFTGELVTRGGGFTSARIVQDADLSGYDGVELRVRGGGRTFEMEVNDRTRARRREVSRRTAFDTTDEWQIVRIPFADLTASSFGQSVSVGPLERGDIRSFGIFIADGQDGPFRLEVDWIRAYADA